MDAIVIKSFGPASVLQLEKFPIPTVTKSTVLVKVKAVGINPVDTYIREGTYRFCPELPYVPGKDGAGIVQAIGEDVTEFKVNQRVFISGRKLGKNGTYAEYSLVPAEDLFPLNDQLSFEQGAALGIPYFTAYRALCISAKCTPKEKVLVHGASGAVGIAAVQIAKNQGLTVIGTAGTPEGMALVKKNGADHVVCHRENKYMEKIMEITNNAGVDIIVEMLADKNLDADLDVLAPKGRVAIVGCRGSVKLEPRKMMIPETQICGVAYNSCTEEEWKTTSSAILKGISEGWVKPEVDKVYPLSEAAQAQEDLLKSTGAKGNIILTIKS